MNSSKMVADPTSLWGRAQVHPWPELSRTLRLGKAIHPPGPLSTSKVPHIHSLPWHLLQFGSFEWSFM